MPWRQYPQRQRHKDLSPRGGKHFNPLMTACKQVDDLKFKFHLGNMHAHVSYACLHANL